MKKIIIIAFVTMILTGCFTTRSQLNESGDAAQMTPNPVQNNGYDVDELRENMTRLTGRVDELERSAAQNASSWKNSDEYKSLTKRMDDLEKAQLESLEAIKKLQTQQPQPDRTELLQQGRKSFKAHDYSGASDALSQYLQNPNAKYAEEAYFFRGESLYQLKNYKKAILDFANFPDKYSKSSYYSKAILRIGESYELLGMKEEAKAFLQEVVTKYPKTPEAKEAGKKLKTLQ